MFIYFVILFVAKEKQSKMAEELVNLLSVEDQLLYLVEICHAINPE